MKRVQLFSVVVEDLMVADHAEFYEKMHMPMLSSMHVRGGEGEIACSPVGKKLTMPIRKHWRRTELSPEYLALATGEYLDPNEAFTTTETYIAIDPAAEKVLDIEINEMIRLREVECSLQGRLNRLQTECEMYEDKVTSFILASLWTRIKWVFTGVQDV